MRLPRRPRLLWPMLCAGLFTFGGTSRARAQEIMPGSAERETGRDDYWRVLYENDFFAATDRDYTQGLLIEWVSPRLSRLPVGRLLLRPRGSTVRAGVAFEDDGYTGSDLKSAVMLPGDHPYAGTKLLRLFGIATDRAGERRVTSGLTVGIIGPAAGGKQIQTFLHRVTGNTIPQGWSQQIRNDVLVNYDAELTQRLVTVGRAAELLVHGGARIGTLNTSASVGTTLMVGWLRPGASRTLYAYARPTVEATAYDATLQGGLLNRGSPYVIPARALHRVTYGHRVGLAFRVGGRYVEYFRTYAAPRFRGGRAHQTGGVAFGWPLGR